MSDLTDLTDLTAITTIKNAFERIDDFNAACAMTSASHCDVVLLTDGRMVTHEASCVSPDELVRWVRPCGFEGIEEPARNALGKGVTDERWNEIAEEAIADYLFYYEDEQERRFESAISAALEDAALESAALEGFERRLAEETPSPTR